MYYLRDVTARLDRIADKLEALGHARVALALDKISDRLDGVIASSIIDEYNDAVSVPEKRKGFRQKMLGVDMLSTERADGQIVFTRGESNSFFMIPETGSTDIPLFPKFFFESIPPNQLHNFLSVCYEIKHVADQDTLLVLITPAKVAKYGDQWKLVHKGEIKVRP